MLQLKIKLLLCAIKAFATTWWNLSKVVKVISMSRPTLRSLLSLTCIFESLHCEAVQFLRPLSLFNFFFKNDANGGLPFFADTVTFLHSATTDLSPLFFPHNLSLETNVTSVLSFPVSLFNESDFPVGHTHIMVSYIQEYCNKNTVFINF